MAGEGVPCLGDQEANPEDLGACLAERSFQEEEGVACSYLEGQVVHPCLGVEEAFPYLVAVVACPCLVAGVACPFLEEEEAVIHLTSLHQEEEEEEEADYSRPSQEGVEVEVACPSLVGEGYSPSAADIASRIIASAPLSSPAPQHS